MNGEEDFSLGAFAAALDKMAHARIVAHVTKEKLDHLVSAAIERVVTAAVERALNEITGGYGYGNTFNTRVKEIVEQRCANLQPKGFEGFVESVVDKCVTPARTKALVNAMGRRIDREAASNFQYRLESAVWCAIEKKFIAAIDQNAELFTKKTLERLRLMSR